MKIEMMKKIVELQELLNYTHVSEETIIELVSMMEEHIKFYMGFG